MYYRLVGKTAVPCSLLEWGIMFEKASERTVAKTTFGDVTVSTVFLGIDHSFGDGPPLLFETMIFGGEFDDDLRRYETWSEAEQGHQEMCAMVSKTRTEPQ